ncbi:hypothetical protein [Micromonospora zamorensis]|uniref:hypothetical protein n=1 Tax=Micromonospora zamorensis TaxID=709883 RepID=UPI003CEC8F12
MNNLPDLAIGLPSDREVTLTRPFDAPRELVYAAHTQAEHLRRSAPPSRAAPASTPRRSATA